MIPENQRFFSLSGLRLFLQAFNQFRLQIVTLSVLGFAGGLLEGVGINAIVPLFSFIDKKQDAEMDFISEAIRNFFLFFNLDYTARSLLIFIISLFVIKAIITFLISQISAGITYGFERKARGDIFKLMAEADWSYLSQQKIGYLDQILTTHVVNSSGVLYCASQLILIATTLFFYGLEFFNIST